MRNIVITVAYDGTAYAGWQVQLNGNTVAGEINKAILSLTGKKSILYGSGRTDSGVHAIAQTANFKTEFTASCEKIMAGLNFYLPKDIRVTSAREADLSFNSRFGAKEKTYVYLIYNATVLPPFYINRAWHVKYPLDITAMKTAAKEIEGKRDFAAFMSAGSYVKGTVRNITELTVVRMGDVIAITVTADGFLYNMVRIIAGTLMSAGMGKLSTEQVRQIVESCDRSIGAPTAPPQGLYLKEVRYQ